MEKIQKLGRRTRLLLLLVLTFFTIPLIKNHAENTNNLSYSILPLAISSQGLPEIYVEIEENTFPLVLDTGASSTEITLSPKILTQINASLTGEKGQFHDIVGDIHDYEVYTIPELKIGNCTLKNLKAQTFFGLWGGNNEGFIETPASQNGVIGLGLLKKFKGLLIDYSENQILFLKKDFLPMEYDLTTWTQIPFEINGGIATFINVNKKERTFLWDTGSNFSPVKKNIFSDIEKYSRNTIRKHEVICVNDLNVNGKEFGPFYCTFFPEQTAFPDDGIIGGTFFNDNAVFIDFEKQLIFFKSKHA